MHMCVYVCMCVIAHACVHMCVGMCVCDCTCMCVGMCVNVCKHMHACAWRWFLGHWGDAGNEKHIAAAVDGMQGLEKAAAEACVGAPNGDRCGKCPWVASSAGKVDVGTALAWQCLGWSVSATGRWSVRRSGRERGARGC